jgi:hypothetical protein
LAQNHKKMLIAGGPAATGIPREGQAAIRNSREGKLFCGRLLDQQAPPGSEPENDFTAGFAPVKTSPGQEDPDAGPDAALAETGVQRLDNLPDAAALVVCDSPEDGEMSLGWFENLGWGK